MNLDRFSQPMHGETFFRDPKVIGECEHCADELHEGNEAFEADGMLFCDKNECFLNWATEEFSGRIKVMGDEQ